MKGPGISDDDELTPEGLSRDKSDLFSGTALGRAMEKKEEEQHKELTKAREIVESKVALAKADELNLEDPAVEALRDAVGDLSEETEAAALVEHQEKNEAREKISELEALAGTTDGAASKRFEERAEALREKHNLQPEPDRYDRVEALVANEESADEPDADAEALAEFRERKEATVEEADLPDDAKARLADFKTMREQASSESLREIYQEKIDSLLEEHSQ